MERINDYEEYKSRISLWVDDNIKYTNPNNPTAEMVWIISHAKNNTFAASFVFQDEDARHFNHDVKLECQKRLTH